MKFHVYYEADSEHLLISDSQTHSKKNKTFLNSGVVNVLSLPGGKVRHVYDFLPPQGKYKSASLIIGGNDCFVKGGALSGQSSQQIAGDLKTLADTIVPRTGLVHVIGIPERHNKKNGQPKSTRYSSASVPRQTGSTEVCRSTSGPTISLKTLSISLTRASKT